MAASSRRTYDEELVGHALRSPWWWSLADNPPCRDWCQAEHDPNEFRVEGMLSCSRPIGDQGLIAVRQCQYADDDTPFLVIVDEMLIDVLERIDDRTPEGAVRLAEDLVAAAAFCREASA